MCARLCEALRAEASKADRPLHRARAGTSGLPTSTAPELISGHPGSPGSEPVWEERKSQQGSRVPALLLLCPFSSLGLSFSIINGSMVFCEANKFASYFISSLQKNSAVSWTMNQVSILPLDGRERRI